MIVVMEHKERKAILDSHDGKLMAMISMNAAIGSLIFIFVKSFLLTVPFIVMVFLGLFAWFPRKIDETNIDMADRNKVFVIKILVILFVATFIAVSWLVARDIKVY
jgi:asparagine N-glycosylation enzyme membrane subunit Stt3